MSIREPDELVCGTTCVDPPADAAARSFMADAAWIGPMAALFDAMGDPTRLRLLASLAQEPRCTCDLAALSGVSDSAVSHQLRMLKELNLVRSRREGKFVYHELADEHVGGLIELARQHVAEGSAR